MVENSTARAASWELASSSATATGRSRCTATPTTSGCTRGRCRRRYHQVLVTAMTDRTHAGSHRRRRPYAGGHRAPRKRPGTTPPSACPLSCGPRASEKIQQGQPTAALPGRGRAQLTKCAGPPPGEQWRGRPASR